MDEYQKRWRAQLTLGQYINSTSQNFMRLVAYADPGTTGRILLDATTTTFLKPYCFTENLPSNIYNTLDHNRNELLYALPLKQNIEWLFSKINQLYLSLQNHDCGQCSGHWNGLEGCLDLWSWHQQMKLTYRLVCMGARYFIHRHSCSSSTVSFY